jgi:hypothetical protein
MLALLALIHSLQTTIPFFFFNFTMPLALLHQATENETAENIYFFLPQTGKC